MRVWSSFRHVRTTKEPVQPIPKFSELIDLLMLPDNHHVVLNVRFPLTLLKQIDCKMQNDPETLFPRMAEILAYDSRLCASDFRLHPGWETLLAPRLILGLWHPIFIQPAFKYLPLLRRYHIGFSLDIAHKYFWEACEGGLFFNSLSQVSRYTFRCSSAARVKSSSVNVSPTAKKFVCGQSIQTRRCGQHWDGASKLF